MPSEESVVIIPLWIGELVNSRPNQICQWLLCLYITKARHFNFVEVSPTVASLRPSVPSVDMFRRRMHLLSRSTL